jgi:hypothetical protein
MCRVGASCRDRGLDLGYERWEVVGTARCIAFFHVPATRRDEKELGCVNSANVSTETVCYREWNDV